MSQHNLPKLQFAHVDDLKIPDFDERKTVQIAALYEDTGDTSRPIEWNNWLRAVGWDDDEILDIREELDARASFEKMVGPYCCGIAKI